jgi:hypothetical protein
MLFKYYYQLGTPVLFLYWRYLASSAPMQESGGGGNMNSRLIVFSAALLYSSAASAQQTTASAQPVTVQLECHDLASSGNFVASDETLVNGMACRQVRQKPKQSLAGQPSGAATVQSTEQTNARASASVQSNFAASSTAAAPSSAPADNQPAAGVATAPATAASMKIVAGAKVYIAPMEGFENYLVAAFGKKKVQLIPVADQNQADYVISGTSVDKKAGWAKIAFMGNIHSDNAASITMADRRTGAIVYAYAVDKKSTLHGQQTTAEACAKHLEAHIEGHN